MVIKIRIPNTQGTFQGECMFLGMVKSARCTRLTGVGGGMQLVDISTKNVGGNDLTQRMKYIMVRLDI